MLTASVIGGVSLLGIIYFGLMFIIWVISLITGWKPPGGGGPRKRAGLKFRHTSDTRWK